MNELTDTQDYTSVNTSGNIIPTIPIEFSKGFQKKRLDHRHHALDALVIACATRDHINLLNNTSAQTKNSRYDLQYKLRQRVAYKDDNGQERERFSSFKLPWRTFTIDAKKELEQIVVSFKQNLRVINKTSNKYQKYVMKNGEMVKAYVSQSKGDSWAIRKALHKDTVSGKVELSRIKVPKGRILTATRKPIDTTFNLKKIESITDTGIQKILINYLESKNNDPTVAFTPEGLEDMNNHIELYNNGKPHQPIYKARIFEVGSKFQVGRTGNKSAKYVEAAKGTNLFFGIYQDQNGKRNYETIPLNEVIERLKQGLAPVPEMNEKGHELLFHLSPNDLVYVPYDGENFDENNFDPNRIYKMVSFTSGQGFFVQHHVSTPIVQKMEFSALNKMERAMNNEMIKDVCIKLNVERLGKISF